MEMGGSYSGTSRRQWPKDQFLDLVFSWSTPDIFNENLYKNQGEEYCECLPLNNRKIHEMLEPDLSSKLNESQLEAILVSLSKTYCHHKSSVELIWGPPGTGKTTTLSILLYTLLQMNVRTLICAPTNVAITELASRVVALVKSSVKTESDKCFGSCPMGDMLIFGNKDSLKVGSDIEEIFLDHRVKRLVECVTPFTGWKHCVDSMLDFLEDCVSQHQIFTENKMIKASQSPQDDEVCQHSQFMSLLEFARDRFSHLVNPLRECMLTILTHIPRRFIREDTVPTIRQLMLCLDSIEMLLFEDTSMTCNEFESIFLRKGLSVGSEPSVDATSSLLFVRSHCMSILKSLRTSLLEIGLPLLCPIGAEKSSMRELCYQKASLIFCTTSSSFKLHSVDMEPVNLLIIDEAAQMKESESVIPLQIRDVRHAVLVGDECQLPATVKSPLSQEVGFGRSLFERLTSLGHSKHLLNVQYRMHPSISRFPNSNFYLNQILDAPCVQSPSYEKCYLQGRMFGPYSFINIRDGKEELDDVGHSRRNMVEVAVAVKLVHKLFKAWNGSNENIRIGLISPYAAQVAAIRDKLYRKYENNTGFTVKVKSVDGFQGGEEDIIIISTVRSHKGGSIGFLASIQRTNVALTRARHCLWILGNERTLCKSDSVWEAIVCDAKRCKCFFNADEDHDFGKTVIEVKKELDQLDDLLSEDCVLFRHSRWKVNVDTTCEGSSYIVKQFKVEKYYVVCSVDIIKDAVYVQVLKVWDILPMAGTPRLLKRLDGIFAMYTDDFINHCNTKMLESNLEVPNYYHQYIIASRVSMATDNKLDYLDQPSENVLRQIFVTVSPKLCYAVKKHVSQLQSFASGNNLETKFSDMDGIDELTEFRDISDSFIGIEQEKYPLVITFNKFLMMLDRTLGNSYFERFRDARCLSQFEGRRSVALQSFIRNNEVTYDHFYWPHFNANLRKNLDPSRVFTEIMSHIKGCLQVGNICGGKRSRQDYISLSDSRVSTFSRSQLMYCLQRRVLFMASLLLYLYNRTS